MRKLGSEVVKDKVQLTTSITFSKAIVNVELQEIKNEEEKEGVVLV